VTIQLKPTLDYHTFSREAAVEALMRDGAVSVALDRKQGECASRFVSSMDLFNEAVRKRSGVINVVTPAARALWAVVKLAVFHGKLVGLMPFVVLDKPHAWIKQIDREGRTCLEFLGHPR